MENPNANKLFEEAKNRYNYKFIIEYPEKLETEINNINSNAIKFIAIEGAFITLIITIFFNSLTSNVSAINGWSTLILLILFDIYFFWIIISIYYLIKCILVKKYDYFMFILKNDELDEKILSFTNENFENFEKVKKFTESYTEFRKSLKMISENKKALNTKEEYFKTATYLFIGSVIVLFIISFISINLILI